MDKAIESKATIVTFFEDRAQVQRRATVVLKAGRHDVSIVGITALADDSTLVCRIVDGEGRVLTSRVHRFMRKVTAGTDDEIDALDQKVRDQKRELEGVRRTLSRQQNQFERLWAMEAATLRSMYAVPISEVVDAASWSEALQKVGEAFERSLDLQDEASQGVHASRRAVERSQTLLSQARSEHHEIKAEARVQLEVPTDGTVTLELEYYTPCALWRPSHVARLIADRASIDWASVGTVWQQTGEIWDDVQCRFSTARPRDAASAPLLSDDWLNARPKTDEERRVVNVEARDVDIASTGSEVAGQVEQMPGVDDGGEPLTLSALEAVSIPSTGEPFRVEIDTHNVDCTTELVAFPERATVPFLRARGTWSHDRPILAGPVVVMRGNEYAGRSRVDYVGAGETFELGFGVDSGVSIHRSLDDEHKTTAVTGKNILHRTIDIFLSNLSSERRHMTVTERVPVSEIEEVEVKKVEAEVQPDQDGYVEFAVELGPRSVSKHTIRYRVEYGSKVRLTW